MKELLIKEGITRRLATRIISNIDVFIEKLRREREDEVIEKELLNISTRNSDIINTTRYMY